MEFDSSRRKFLQAGLVLPAAGFVAAHHPDAFAQAPATRAVYRTLGKTGLKVFSVGCGIGLIADPAVLIRAVDLGVNYFDTARMYEKGKREEIAGEALNGRRNESVIRQQYLHLIAPRLRRSLVPLLCPGLTAGPSHCRSFGPDREF